MKLAGLMFRKILYRDKIVFLTFTFDPSIDNAYVRDMKAMTDYMLASGRIKTAKDVLEYTYSDPVAAVDPALVKVAGRFKI